MCSLPPGMDPAISNSLLTLPGLLHFVYTSFNMFESVAHPL